MIFKTASSFSRTAAAAKAAWVSSSGQPVPGFFISTPQYQRQRSQVGPYLGEARKYSNGVDSGFFLTFPSGPNFTSGAASSSLDDDDRDAKGSKGVRRPFLAEPLRKVTHFQDSDTAPRVPDGPADTELNCADTSSAQTEATEDQRHQSVTEGSLAGDQRDGSSGRLAGDTVAGALVLMEEEQQAGNHAHVLSTFSELEQSTNEIPLSVYNLLLKSIAAMNIEAMDVTMLLQAYEQLLQRDITPDRETYSLLVHTLVAVAERLSVCRDQLSLAVGRPGRSTGAAEDVLSLYPVEDHLRLALSIFKASLSVDGSNFCQDAVDLLVRACAKYRVDTTELASLVSGKAALAALHFAKSPEETEMWFAKLQSTEVPREELKDAYIESLVRVGSLDAAVRAYEQEISAGTSSKAMLLSLINGFVSKRLYATTLRWVRESGLLRLGVEECSKILLALCEPMELTALPSAALLYQLVGSHKNAASSLDFELARSRLLDLAVAARNDEVVLAIIKETHLRDGQWTPSTTTETVKFLISRSNAALAIDVFVNQAQKLALSWAARDVATHFIGEEMLDEITHCLSPHLSSSDGLELALKLLRVPFLSRTFNARLVVLERIWRARSDLDPVLSTKISESPSLLTLIVELHTRMVLDSEGHMGLAIPPDQLTALGNMIPLFVSDIVQNGGAVGADLSMKIEKTLVLLGLDPTPWVAYAQRAPTNTLVPVSDDASIIRYAATTNGLPEAMTLLKDLFLRQRVPSAEVLASVVAATVRANSVVHLRVLASQIEKNIPYTSTDEWLAANRALVTAAGLDYGIALGAHGCLIEHKYGPTADGYAALLEHLPAEANGAAMAVSYYNEIKDFRIAGNTRFYNAVLSKLNLYGRFTDVDSIFSDMKALNMPRNVQTYETMILSKLTRNVPEEAVDLISEMPAATDFVPHARPYNILMEYFVRTKRSREDALRVWGHLRHRKIIMTPGSYSLLMDAWLLPPHDLPQADHVLNMIEEDGAPFSTEHFARLLRARGVLARDLTSARSFYRALVKNGRVLPDKHIFKALMDSYVANGHVKDAPQVLDEMAKYHVPVTDAIFGSLVEGWTGEKSVQARNLQQIHNNQAVTGA